MVIENKKRVNQWKLQKAIMWVFLQVTKDDCHVHFHEDFILSEKWECDRERVSEVCLAEFLSYGPEREEGKERKCLLRKTDDGKIVKWDVETNDSLCTLEEAFQKVELSLGFNIELKFDDNVVFFLTNGRTEIYNDTRRNSLEQAINVYLEGGFQGIVSEIKGVFKNPGAAPKIKDSNLSLLTYGTLK
ncbi:hypothetical protein Goshw_010178 [Gossypium schwendimanii]|uniref:Uncharacterized protein n=1 Tax=Gossypium schwendimanii TaxID=34291 RepID=A0A7J9LEN2_GOSSC|nr:hypothetical protein [Gossypium schwendimanii]